MELNKHISSINKTKMPKLVSPVVLLDQSLIESFSFTDVFSL